MLLHSTPDCCACAIRVGSVMEYSPSRSIHHSCPPGPTRCIACTESAIGGKSTCVPCVPVEIAPANDCPLLPPNVAIANPILKESRIASSLQLSSQIVIPAST